MQESMYNSINKLNKYEDVKKRYENEHTRNKYNMQLAQGFSVVDTFLNNRYLDYFSSGSVAPLDDADKDKNISKIRLYKISKIVFDPKEDINEKLINVYSSIHTMNSTVAVIINSDEKLISFYIAVRSDDNSELAGTTICNSLIGNFPGINIDKVESNDKKSIINSISSDKKSSKSLTTVSLIPSVRDENNKEDFVQGMEKFLGSMRGKCFSAVLLASPVNETILSQRRHGFEEMYSQLSPHSKLTLSYAQSQTKSVNESLSESFSKSVNNSVSNSNGYSSSNSYGGSYGTSSGSSVGADGWSVNSGSSTSSFSSYTSGTNFTNTVSESTGRTTTDGINKGSSLSEGYTDTTTLNFENKSVSVLMERAENQLKRIDLSETYGMWDFCAYFFSDDISVSMQAANVYKALMLGNNSFIERAHINVWNVNKQAEIAKIADNVKYLMHPLSEIPTYGNFLPQTVIPTNMVNGEELPIVLGFPRKSLPGIAVVEMAEFGRFVVFEKESKNKRLIELGNIYHMGVTEEIRVSFDLDLLASHCFITGSSGSGKSYATYNLLDNLVVSQTK